MRRCPGCSAKPSDAAPPVPAGGWRPITCKAWLQCPPRRRRPLSVTFLTECCLSRLTFLSADIVFDLLISGHHGDLAGDLADGASGECAGSLVEAGSRPDRRVQVAQLCLTPRWPTQRPPTRFARLAAPSLASRHPAERPSRPGHRWPWPQIEAQYLPPRRPGQRPPQPGQRWLWGQMGTPYLVPHRPMGRPANLRHRSP